MILYNNQSFTVTNYSVDEIRQVLWDKKLPHYYKNWYVKAKVTKEITFGKMTWLSVDVPSLNAKNVFLQRNWILAFTIKNTLNWREMTFQSFSEFFLQEKTFYNNIEHKRRLVLERKGKLPYMGTQTAPARPDEKVKNTCNMNKNKGIH
jgi:hypothetical protein